MDSAGQNTVTGGHITSLIEPCINDIKENQKSLFPGQFKLCASFQVLFLVVTETNNNRSWLWVSENKQSGRRYFIVSRKGLFFQLQKLPVFGLFSKERHTTNSPIWPVLIAELRRAKRACGAPWVSKSTHPRKFGNHVTVHRPPALPLPVRPHHRHTNIYSHTFQLLWEPRRKLIAHQCCHQLTAVKTGYPLTSIT